MDINSLTNSVFQNSQSTSQAAAKANKLSNSLSNLSENSTDAELMDACKSFESYLVEHVIKSTRKAMLSNKEEEEGEYTKYFGDYLNQGYADIITENANLGIAQMLYESMKKN